MSNMLSDLDGAEDLTVDYDVQEAEPDVGINFGVDITSVKFIGDSLELIDALNKEEIEQLESEAYDRERDREQYDPSDWP